MKRWSSIALTKSALQACKRDDRGAVSVDWVVLSAAIIVIGLLAWSIIEGGVLEGSSQIREAVLSAESF